MTFKMKKQANKTRSKYRAKAVAKIKRLQQKGFNVNAIDIIGFNPDQKEFTSRREFNQWKKAIDTFTNRFNYDYKVKRNRRGMEYLPAEAKAYEKRQKQAIENARKKREQLDSRPVYNQKGELVGTSKSIKDTVNERKQKNFYSVPSELKIDDMINRRVFEERMEIMEERATESWYTKKDKQMLDNWVDVLRRAHGHDAIDIIERLENMPASDFVEMFEMFTSYDFELYASQDGEFLGHNEVEQLRSLRRSLDMYDRGELDLSMKVFKER